MIDETAILHKPADSSRPVNSYEILPGQGLFCLLKIPCDLVELSAPVEVPVNREIDGRMLRLLELCGKSERSACIPDAGLLFQIFNMVFGSGPLLEHDADRQPGGIQRL
jgi:hypothetical protein